jgi:hypothetical protein
VALHTDDEQPFKGPQEATHHEGLLVLTGHRRQKAWEVRLAFRPDTCHASAEREQWAPLAGQKAQKSKSEWRRSVDWIHVPEV